MNIIVTGATGMAGSEVVRQALADPGITRVTAIVRRPLPLDHFKLQTIIHTNFLDYKSLFPLFRDSAACIWCQGVSRLQVSGKKYRRIIYQHTMAAAVTAATYNLSSRFVFLSCDLRGYSKKEGTQLKGIRGETEKKLYYLLGERLHIVRPAGILPIHPLIYPTLFKRIQLLKRSILASINPNRIITTEELAKILLYLAKKDSDAGLLRHYDLMQIVR